MSTGNHEGNWALAWRRQTDANRIVGLWGSYDLRESPTGNHFDQAAFGLEVLSVEKEFRFNGYVPTNLDPKQVPGTSLDTVISNNNLVLRRNQETAYWGVDGEFGRLLWSNDPCDAQQESWYAGFDAELRAFVGGFYFDNPDASFDQIAGPRVRAELRLYDLAMLGAGSRLTLEGLVQDDQLRGTQAKAGLYVRIPFGPRPSRLLDRLQRRMIDRIVRDVDVVASHQVTEEAAQFASTGLEVSTARVVNAANDLSATVATAGANSLVVVDGSAGTFSEGDTTTLSAGQVILGGGGTLDVIGAETGTQVTFTAPGTRPQISGTDTQQDVFHIANDTVLAGLDISGGANGVSGDSVTGFTLRDLDVSAATNNGVYLENTNSGSIQTNTFHNNGNDGLRVSTLSGGTIRGNTASSNTVDGFYVADFISGTIGENSATGNNTGLAILNMMGGTINENSATENNTGFSLSSFNSGAISNNDASNNGTGFSLGTFDGGTMSGNTASSNDGTGFGVSTFSGGSISDNTANSNHDGFYIQTLSGGTITNNTSSGNSHHGFYLHTLITGTASSNLALGNSSAGFYSANTSGNNTASVNSNHAASNQYGYLFYVAPPANGSGTNTGSANGSYNSF